jgi:hypothetical protein
MNYKQHTFSTSFQCFFKVISFPQADASAEGLLFLRLGALRLRPQYKGAQGLIFPPLETFWWIVVFFFSGGFWVVCLGGQLCLDTTIHEMSKAGQSGTAVRHLACGTFGLGVCAAKIASGRPAVSPSFTILIDHKNDEL